MKPAAKRTQKTKKLPPRKRLCHAAKISDYRFKRLLRCFVEDVSATEAASRLGLSVGSVNAIYRKLRAFLAETSLFDNLYEIDPTPPPEAELQYIRFHLARVGRKRGIAPDDLSHDLHFRESCWRYECQLLSGFGARSVQDMMYQDILALIRRCGPVGRPVRNPLAAYKYLLERNERIAAWLQRNSAELRDPRHREQLRRIRDL
jgi:hypothetical protein